MRGKSYRLTLIFSTLATGAVFVLAATASAWTGPTASPTGGNVSAPVNVGSTDQVKNAGLGVNALAVFGNSILSANTYLNWGATAGSTGYGIRDNAGTLEFKNSAGSWASLQSTIFNYCSGGACGGGSVAWTSVTGKPFNYTGQSGQPTWLWGTNDGANYYVWNPSNFSVSYANSAGSAPWASITGKPTTISGSFDAGCTHVDVNGGLLTGYGTSGNCTGPDIAERYDTDGTVPVVRGLIVAYSDKTTTRHFLVNNPAPGESTATPYTMTTANMHVASAAERDRIFGAVPTMPFNITETSMPAEPDTQLVTLIGHVPVHMTLDGGPVAIGDPITVSNSTPGYGMKATTGGKIVGYALAPYIESGGGEAGTDMIEVFIHPEEWQPVGMLCASDAGGATCITRAQLDDLLSAHK